MVTVKFIDGTQETYETKGSEKQPWEFDRVGQCYKLDTVTGMVVISREYVKSLEHYETEDVVDNRINEFLQDARKQLSF